MHRTIAAGKTDHTLKIPDTWGMSMVCGLKMPESWST
jgi:hypothetical protein